MFDIDKINAGVEDFELALSKPLTPEMEKYLSHSLSTLKAVQANCQSYLDLGNKG